jgi:hypothetical protein
MPGIAWNGGWSLCRSFLDGREGTFCVKVLPGETLRLDPQGHSGEYWVQVESVNMRAGLVAALASALGMMLVAIVAVISWRCISHVSFRWFWIGAGLWTIAVAVKVVCALATNAAVIGFLRACLQIDRNV